MNKTYTNIVKGATAVLIAMLGGMTAQADTLEWANSEGDSDFSNSNNWSLVSEGTYDFRNISLASPDHPTVSAGQSNVVSDVRVGISGAGQLDITGGFLRSDRTGGDDRMGYGNVAVINQSGGTYEIAHDLVIGIGSGSDATFNLSGGLLSLQGPTGQKLEIANAGTGVLNISGGALETSIGVDIMGTGTFSVQGSTPTSIHIGSQGAGTAYWNQRSGGTLKIMIDSGGVTPIVIDDYNDEGNADVTFAYGALLDVSFVDRFSESNTWTVMTWEGDVTDSGLLFSTNVDYEVWSYAITNNSLQVTYGEGGTAPPTNLPPTGPRTLYWTGDAGTDSMTNANNWATNNGAGTYFVADWGMWEDDILYIGSSDANLDASLVYEATYADEAAENQGELYIGYGRTGVLNFANGSLDFDTANRQVKIGYGSGGHGTLNMNDGTLEGEAFRIGMDTVGNRGVINLSGGSLLAARGATLNSLSTSMSLGESGSTGELNISGGSLSVRFGMLLGNGGGTGIVHVAGSEASLIGIGTKNSGSDGFWVQNSGSTLSVAIDEGGVTPITVEGWGNGGAFATFESNAVLEVNWVPGVTNYGVFDVLTWEGDLTDNGLVLGTNTDADIWDFMFVDADGDSTNDTLRVVAPKGTTAQGTPVWWLYSKGLTEADDEVDADLDGMLSWEEYLAGTDPNDAASVLKLDPLSQTTNGVVVTWQSVVGETYSVEQSENLGGGFSTVATGIVAQAEATSYTGTVNGADTMFFKIGVE
jgi:hypothetical protein